MQEEIRRSSASAGFANTGATYNAILMAAVHNSLGMPCDIILTSVSVSGVLIELAGSLKTSGSGDLAEDHAGFGHNVIECAAMIDVYPALRSRLPVRIKMPSLLRL
ncbi:hypothetical protein J2W40_003654 [Sphingobium xenophagum]|uniref:Uncharacterized protein n=2 Tax=Sphingobium xenophagum TaxID=121428 RepID=A0ABU1X5Q9_SPHXE|nr:hypothetical protein [Sphingobium xenophagum]